MKTKISITIENKLLKNIDGFIDGLFIRNRSQAIEFLINKILSKEKTCVIFGGGLSYLVKKDYFRIMGKLNNETVIEWILGYLKKHAFTKIIIIGNKEINGELFKIVGNGEKQGVTIEYVNDKGLIGTQERLRLLKNKIKTTFLVFPADNVTNLDLTKLWEEHLRNPGKVTLALTSEPNKDPTKFGNVLLEHNVVTVFKQKPVQPVSRVVWTGIMVSEPEITEYEGKMLEDEVFNELIKRKQLYGFLFTGYWHDIHTRQELMNARKSLKYS